MEFKNEFIKCIESNDMIKLSTIMSKIEGTHKLNFNDNEIYKIFINSREKDSILSFNLLFNQLKNKSIIHQNNEFLFRACCKNGAIKIVKWMIDNTLVDIYSKDIDSFFCACYSNNSELILYLHSIVKKNIDYHKNNDELMRICAKSNLVDSVVLLSTFTEFSMNIDKKYNDQYIHENLFHFFCRHGYIDCAKGFLNINKFDINSKNDEAICLACQEGHLEMVKWLYKIGGNIKAQNNWCFGMSISRGNLEMLKWIESLKVVDIHYNYDQFFRSACSFGKLEIAKWLYSFGNVDIHAFMDSAFLTSCSENHVEVAKWLYSLGGYNLHFEDDLFFKFICQQGNIYILQWLHDINEFNVHYQDDFYFRLSCNLNHLEQSKWIYSLGNVNIKSNRNEVFRLACNSNNIEMALWLESINPEEYKVIINNNLITNWKINKIIKMIGEKKVEITECPICFEKNTDLITSCNHQFCKNCFKNYAESQDYSIEELPCPYCRQSNLKFYNIKK